MHIPAPLEIGNVNSADMAERAKEILTLSKMNWNSAASNNVSVRASSRGTYVRDLG